MTKFGDDLEIVDLVHDPDKSLNTDNLNMVLTTFSNSDTLSKVSENLEIVKIHEYIQESDLTNIQTALFSIKSKQFSKNVRKQLTKFIRSEFFFRSERIQSKELILSTIYDVLSEYGYVRDDYLNELNEREELSATSFPSHVAVPHTLQLDSLKTGIVVCVFNNDVQWGEHRVKLVLGISVNKNDTRTFNLLFQRIIEIISENENVDYLSTSDSRKVFLSRLESLMTANNYFPE